MSKVTNKDIAKAFRDAVPHLIVDEYEYYDDDKSVYICHAIALGSGACRGRITNAGAKAARDIINERIDWFSGLGVWLREKHGIVPDSTKALQAHRHAWLQLLIKEFESK